MNCRHCGKAITEQKDDLETWYRHDDGYYVCRGYDTLAEPDHRINTKESGEQVNWTESDGVCTSDSWRW